MKKKTQLKNFRSKLNEIKDLINKDLNTLNFKEIYEKLYDTCFEHECETGDCRFTDKLQESPILDEDDLRYFFQKVKTIPDMRDFLNTTQQADIYKIDQYDNLENVTSTDMLQLCDEMIDLINASLKLREDEMV